MANENVMWRIIWFCVSNDGALLRSMRLIDPIGDKRTRGCVKIDTSSFYSSFTLSTT